MKKSKLVIIVLNLSFCLLNSCSVYMENKEPKYESFATVEKMKNLRQTTITDVYNLISKSSTPELTNSKVFKECGQKSRNIESEQDYLTEEEQQLLIQNIPEEEVIEITKIFEAYIKRVEDLAAISVFNPSDLPEGVYETDTEIIIGDYCYLKTVPEDLEIALSVANQYYSSKSSRGAVFHALIGTMSFDGWPGGIVYYGFDDFPSNEKSVVMNCMSDWSSKSNNIVVFKNNGDFNWFSRMMWSLGVNRVLRIQQKNLPGGSLGRTTPGRLFAPYMYLDVNKINSYSRYRLQTYRHELGHALGLQHEFDRSDRDENVLWYDNSVGSWDDISINGISRFLFITKYGDFDYNSVMNYAGFYCKKNEDGSKGALIELKDIENISSGDANVIQTIYKKFK